MIKETKSFPFKIQEVDEWGEFIGYASTFGNVDLGNDRVIHGAFRKTLLETEGGKLPILDHHDPTRQIGWNLSAQEDQHGLLVRGQLDLNVQLARERHSLMKMAAKVGGNTGLSIGFQTIRARADKKQPKVRVIQEVKLFEYSIVVFPMNPQAAVTDVKSHQHLIHCMKRVIASIRDH